jgi:dihydrofolate synthase/folylpolyglutamate synthase
MGNRSISAQKKYRSSGMKAMKTKYRDAIRELYGLQKYGIKFGLSKTKLLLQRLGNPHQGRRFIHIGGSNGKGSVAAMLESILRASGLKVGFYSSPHLVRFTERFRIDGSEIAPSDAADLAVEVMGHMDPKDPATFFEVATVMALACFARARTDIDIMEVGMGGRLDATNVIHPMVSVITNISLEHRAFLGKRLLDIAYEKAGIIKKGVDVVTAVTQPPVIKQFESICLERQAPLIRIGKDVRYRFQGSRLHYYGLHRSWGGLELGLGGRFQPRNGALTLAVTERLEDLGIMMTSQAIRKGLHSARWPARFHILSKDPTIIVDGAHNPAAVRALAETVKADFHYKRLILVMGIMEDKDIHAIMRVVVPQSDFVILTRPRYERAAPPERLMPFATIFGKRVEICGDIPQALDKAKKIADPKDLIVICGSLFTAGEALTYFDPETYRPD